MACGLIGIWKTFTGFADNTLTVHQVKLKKDGLHAEISVLNWLGQVKNNKYLVNIKDLAPPPLHPDSVPLKGDLFPHMVEVFEIQSEYIQLPWVKYYDVVRKRLFIPKDYAFMNREIMVAVMNGFYIKT